MIRLRAFIPGTVFYQHEPGWSACLDKVFTRMRGRSWWIQYHYFSGAGDIYTLQGWYIDLAAPGGETGFIEFYPP